MTASLFDRIRFAREGAAVERCHTAPHLQRYSVGHHSLDLVTLVTLAWQADHGSELPSAALLIACAFHDIPERATGDVPSVVKDLCPQIETVDERILTALGVNVALTAEERSYLRWGDRLELFLWCMEERARGNNAFDSWRASYAEMFIDAKSSMPPAYYEIFSFTLGWQGTRLSYHALKVISGIEA